MGATDNREESSVSETQDIEFEFMEELPGKLRRSADPVLVRFAEALRANPGVWAKYPNSLTTASRGNMAFLIKNGRDNAPVPFRNKGFEATNRGGTLYVRWVGDGAK